MMLMGRRLRSFLPCTETHLQPRRPKYNKIRQALSRRQQTQKIYYDRSAKDLPELSSGDDINIRLDDEWNMGKVIDQTENPRSYIVKDEGGSTYRRNRIDLRPQITTREVPEERREIPSTTQEDDVIRTRSGRASRPPDRLNYH
ncbi:Uncharacterised protein r2_g3205 [Pycnogonum litorale]